MVLETMWLPLPSLHAGPSDEDLATHVSNLLGHPLASV